MTINGALLKAILSMDSYNRSYQEGMKINSEYSLGGYTKIADSSFFGDAVDETGNPILDQDGNPIRKDQNIDFYAIA